MSHRNRHVVSFVIPTLNEELVLRHCLASIRDLKVPVAVADVETIVVDNQSSDQSVHIAVANGAHVVTVAPGVVARARNAGARAARGDLLAFVDADCELDETWLEVCLAHLESEEVVAVGTAVAPPDNKAPWVQRTWYELTRPRGRRSAGPVAWLPTFNMLVRREVFEGVGAFDESLVTCEDCELGYRLAEHGRLIRETHPPTSHHGESRSLAEFFRREAWRSRGNRALLRSRRTGLREAVSWFVPPAFVTAAAASVVGLAVALFRGGLVWPWGLAILFITCLPVAMLSAKGVSPRRHARLDQCAFLLAVYLCARTAGILASFSRVNRNGRPVG